MESWNEQNSHCCSGDMLSLVETRKLIKYIFQTEPCLVQLRSFERLTIITDINKRVIM